jgi:hypothetical protein
MGHNIAPQGLLRVVRVDCIGIEPNLVRDHDGDAKLGWWVNPSVEEGGWQKANVPNLQAGEAFPKICPDGLAEHAAHLS